MKKLSKTTKALFAGAITLGISHLNAPAAIIVLTGGDPGTSTNGEVTLNSSNVVDAVYSPASNSDTTTFQGVTFEALAADTNLAINYDTHFYSSGTETASQAGFTNGANPDANDIGLLNLVNAGFDFNGNTPDTFTFSGLANYTDYTVDSFLSLINEAGGRTENVAYNSNLTASDTPDLSQTDVVAVEDTVESTSSGTLTVHFEEGSDGAIENAIVISAATPEPSTYALMLAGLGMLAGVLRLRQRNTRLS